MPVYDFRCNSCETEHEELLPHASPNPPCPQCGQRTERLIGLPSIQTDSTLMAGAGTLRSQAGDQFVGQMEKACAARGFRPNGNELYVPTMARFPYDPLAFVTSRKEIKDRVRANGMSCEGAVTVPRRPNYNQKPPPRLAEKIVDRFEKQYIAENPDLARGNRAELRQTIVEKHGSPKED